MLTRAVGADRYVSPPGSLEYLATDHGAFDDLGIEVLVHRYDHPTYDQGRGVFGHGIRRVLGHASDGDPQLGGHGQVHMVEAGAAQRHQPHAQAMQAAQHLAIELVVDEGTNGLHAMGRSGRAGI